MQNLSKNFASPFTFFFTVHWRNKLDLFQSYNIFERWLDMKSFLVYHNISVKLCINVRTISFFPYDDKSKIRRKMYCNRYTLLFRSNLFQVHPTKIDAVNYLLTKHLFETFYMWSFTSTFFCYRGKFTESLS